MGLSLKKIVSEHIPIQKGEWGKVLLMFFYFFLVIATYYIVKPVRSAIFLDRLGPEKLPYVYMGEAILVGIVSFFYARFVDKHRKESILVASTIIFSICLFFFWFLFRFQVSWYAYLFYLWSAIFSVMAVTQFWLLANDIFNPREAKRLFGLIGAGGVLGAISGGFVTAQMVRVVGTENLLLLAAALILFCVVLIKIACRFEPAQIRAKSLDDISVSENGVKRPIMKLILASRYLLLILLLVGVGKILSTFIDFQFQSITDQAFPMKDAKTAFFGNFFAGLNAVAFLIQVLLTGRVLKRWGIATALLLLPVILSFGMLTFALFPFLLFAGFNKFFDGTFNYSIQSAAKEILYLPVDRTIRHKIKPFIDMFIYRFAKGIGGFLILFFMTSFGFAFKELSLVSLVFIILWFLVVVFLKREYIESLKAVISGHSNKVSEFVQMSETLQPEFLESLGDEELRKLFRETSSQSAHCYEKTLSLAQIALLGNSHDSSLIKNFIQNLFAKNASQSQALTRKVLHEDELGSLILDLLKGDLDEKKKIGPRARGRISDDILNRLAIELSDKTHPIHFRKKIIEVLQILDGQAARQLLCSALQDPDEVLQHDICIALEKMRAHEKTPILDYAPLVKSLDQEVSRYSLILYLEKLYQELTAHDSYPEEQNKRFTELFKHFKTEGLERIFHLLSFYYPVEIIQLIRSRYQEADGYVKAHAAELLDNIVGHKVGRLLLPVLEGEVGKVYYDGKWISLDSEEVVHWIFAGKDVWLLLLVIFMVSRLEIKNYFAKIQHLTGDPRPLVKEAARIAMQYIRTTEESVN